MNPYDFVRLVGNGPKRGPAQTHERFNGLCGRLVCRLTLRTHLFLPAYRLDSSDRPAQQHQRLSLLRDSGKRPFLPGSSLKGAIRSVAEAAGNGCMVLPNRFTYERGQVSYRVAEDGFSACRAINRLCPTCRLFGMLQGRSVYTGNVSIQDAKLTSDFESEWVTLPILSAPKPRHRAFYAQPGDHLAIAGRKFYFHRPQGLMDHGGVKSGQNRTVEAIRPGAVFRFEVDYQNLSPADFSLLLFALTLWEDTCHKIGMGKPAGLGSVKIEIEAAQSYDPRQRYLQPGGGRLAELRGAELDDWLAGQTRLYREGNAPNLADLHRILRWDPEHPADTCYPTPTWFSDNPDAPLSEAP